MTGEEWFEFAAAIGAVSVALLAILVLAVAALVAVFRLVRYAADAQQAMTRVASTVEELARSTTAPPADSGRARELEERWERVELRQRQLQDSIRAMAETKGDGAGRKQVAIEDLEKRVVRLDTTVGQMATSLANVIRMLEQQRD